MRRHNTLIPLSRFHRKVLFVAQMAKRNGPKFDGYPTDPSSKADYALNFYRKELSSHFELEERKLFPNVTGYDEALDIMVLAVAEEQRHLRKLFEELPTTEHLTEKLDVLGFALEAHIRKEERQLFQKIQEVLSDEALVNLEKLLHEDHSLG